MLNNHAGYSGFLNLKNLLKGMFRDKVNRLIKEFHVKQIAIINLINSNKVSFANKMKDNSFNEKEKSLIINKYGKIM